LAVRPEDGDACVTKRVADPGRDRRLGPEDGEPDPLPPGELDQLHHVVGANADIAGHAPGAAVAGRAEASLGEVRLHALPGRSVLAGTGADDQDPHAESLAVTPTRSCPAASR